MIVSAILSMRSFFYCSIPVILLSSLFLLSACDGLSGPEGPRGEQGPRGPAGAANITANVYELSSENFEVTELDTRTAIYQSFSDSNLTASVINKGVVLGYILFPGFDVWELMPVYERHYYESSGSTVGFAARFQHSVNEFVFFLDNYSTLFTEEINELKLDFGGTRIKVVAIPPSQTASLAKMEDWKSLSHEQIMRRLDIR